MTFKQESRAKSCQPCNKMSMCKDTRCCPTDSVERLKDALGPTIPEDELRGCRHLMQGPFGKQLFHMMILRAARLELALKRASMPSKGARTSLEAHFSESFVNASILKYTTVLSEGKEPNFQMLLTLPPPKDYQLEPTRAGIPRRWGNPWVKKKNHEGATKTEQET